MVDFSCYVVVNDRNKTVELGCWPTKQLKNTGDTTPPVAFTLHLEGCPPAASISFSGTPEPGQSDLLALGSTSTAQNVAIELRNKDRARLPLRQASEEVAVDAQGNATSTFFANDIAPANNVTAGLAEADATFMIYYN